MKLLKENGMIDTELLEGVCWYLKMSDIERMKQPTDKEGKCTIHPMVWRHNQRNAKFLKSCLEQVLSSQLSNERCYSNIENKRNKIFELETKIKLLEQEKDLVETENSQLKDKIQEAQVTAGLVIQSVKDKLPTWFKKD